MKIEILMNDNNENKDHYYQIIHLAKYNICTNDSDSVTTDKIHKINIKPKACMCINIQTYIATRDKNNKIH